MRGQERVSLEPRRAMHGMGLALLVTWLACASGRPNLPDAPAPQRVARVSGWIVATGWNDELAFDNWNRTRDLSHWRRIEDFASTSVVQLVLTGEYPHELACVIEDVDEGLPEVNGLWACRGHWRHWRP